MSEFDAEIEKWRAALEHKLAAGRRRRKTDGGLIAFGFFLAVAMIACVMLAGCGSYGDGGKLTPNLDCRLVAAEGWNQLWEIRHKGKVYLVLKNIQGPAASGTKLDEWPDAQLKEAGK